MGRSRYITIASAHYHLKSIFSARLLQEKNETHRKIWSPFNMPQQDILELITRMFMGYFQSRDTYVVAKRTLYLGISSDYYKFSVSRAF